MTATDEACMIAPCGINCGTCYVHMRSKNPCPGCLSPDENGKGTHCRACSIKNCALHAEGDPHCHACAKFPCIRLKNLDRRYVRNYGLSLIENQRLLGEIGIASFLDRERRRWVCPHCGAPLSVHLPDCPSCRTLWKQ